MSILVKGFNRIIQILLIINLILWFFFLLVGSVNDSSSSILIYSLLVVAPCCLYLGIRAFLIKILKIKKEVSTVSAKEEFLPKEFFHFCTMKDSKLFIKKCSQLDFIIYIAMYTTIFVLFSMLALSIGGVLGVIFIIFIGTMIFGACLKTIAPLYFANTTRIDFQTGQIDMKNAPFWSSWSTHFINHQSSNLVSVDKGKYYMSGWWYSCDILLNIEGEMYNIKHVTGANQEKVDTFGEDFAEFLTKAFKEKLLAAS